MKRRGKAGMDMRTPSLLLVTFLLLLLHLALFQRVLHHLGTFSHQPLDVPYPYDQPFSKFAVTSPQQCTGEKELFQMVRRMGGKVDGVEMRRFHFGQGIQRRGLAVRRAKKDGQVVLAIPGNLSLSLHRAVEHELLGPPLLHEYRKGNLHEFEGLAIFLLYEAKNVSSLFRPFLCSLPRYVPLPTLEARETFKNGMFANNSRYLNTIWTIGKMFRDSFSRAQKFFAENPGLFPSPIDVREWMWASAIIMSRSWGVKIPKTSLLMQKAERAGNDKMHILVPLADMVNHDAKARKVGISEGGAIVIYAGRNLAAGEEVCITYGDKCNMELMAHYGFFVPHNNKTTCEIDHILQKRMWEK